jgi:transcriptional regulator with XRE-family HTH domain
MSTATIGSSFPSVNRNLCTVFPTVNVMSEGRQDAALLQEVGRRLRERRIARGLTINQLMELSGLDPSQIRGYETGASGKFPSVVTLRRLAAPLKTTVAHLIGDEPAPPLSLYDERPEYRALIDGLEALTVSERRAAKELLQAFLMAMEGGRDFPGSDTPSVRNRTDTPPVVPAGKALDQPQAPPFRATTIPTKGRTRKPFDDGKSRGSSGKERKKRRP